MLVLGGWALGNIATGLAMQGNATQADHYFHQMNVLWNTVNFGLATWGYLQNRNEDVSNYTLRQTIEKNEEVQGVLLLNAGLDVAYMATGVWLHSRGDHAGETFESQAKWRGYGRSLILQGAFLLVFDVTLYLVHRGNHQSWLESAFGKTTAFRIQPDSITYSFYY